MNRLTSILLIFLLVISSLISVPVHANANNNSAVYSGTATSWGHAESIVLTISDIDEENSQFSGNFDLSGDYTYNSNVSGNISGTVENGCSVFSIYFTIDFYNTSFSLTINNNTGVCTGTSSGYAHFENIELNGNAHDSIFSYYGQYNYPVSSLYNECLKYSVDVYDDDFYNEYSTTKCPIDLYDSLDDNEYEDIEAANFSDNDDTNVSYTLAHKTLSNNVEKYVVVIRGTDGIEWEGNMKICPENSQGGFDTYTGNESVHNNFNNAASNLKNTVNQYIADHPSNNDKFLLITGHSRGGAVSNLLAYQYTVDDSFNGVVTAYTFATPNVVQYDSVENMEQYGNIYNFCKNKDFVPCIPLLDGQLNYWKYGKTYIEESSDDDVYCTKLTSIMVDDKYAPTVEDYYNRKFSYNDSAIKISLYDFLQLTLASSMEMNSSILSKVSFARTMLNWVGDGFKGLKSLSSQLRTNLVFIGINHLPLSYRLIPLSGYTQYTYSEAKERLGEIIEVANNESVSSISNRTSSLSPVRNTQYNENEILKLKTFLNQTDNNNISNIDKLNWNINDPATWEGISFNESGNVIIIDLDFCDLYGTLDVSNFSSLMSVNVSANYISSLNLVGCTNLEFLDVSDNNLSLLNVVSNNSLTYLDFSNNNNVESINLSNNSQLINLYCNDCNLSELTITNLNNLEELVCDNNRISELSFVGNSELIKLHCELNNIDIQNNSDQMAQLLSISNRTGSEVIYYPQRIPTSAVFNGDEINCLRNIAINNPSLEWLDNNNQLIIENVQKNILFEKFGNDYRTVAINFSDSEIFGNLNLNCFNNLRELYCENTHINSISVSNCNDLEILNCKNCDVSELSLPDFTNNNIPLYYLDCEFNYLDLSIITSDVINSISSKTDYILDYERQKADIDTLEAIIDFSNDLDSDDYSTASFNELSEQIQLFDSYNFSFLTQNDTDQIITELLTTINSLEPYLKLKLSGENGTITTVYDNETQSGNTHSVLFGESVTLTATPDTNYVFDGWYEKVTKRIYSTNTTYTFPMTTNLDFEARFIKQNAAILSFTNDTGQIVAKYDFTPTEWLEITTLEDLLPDVPYKFQHTNGRWNYTESDVLTALRAGTDVTITPIYDTSNYVYPDAPTPVDGNPVLNLTYEVDNVNDIGSFIMTAGLPQNLDIESIGILFYYKNKNTFNPYNYFLNINNKAVVSRFDTTVPDNRYIVNIHRFTEKYNWCARGFVTYRENGVLKIAYSEQRYYPENDPNTQNRGNEADSRSEIEEPTHHIDVIIGEDD